MTIQALSTSSLGETTGYINAGGRGTRLNTIFTPDSKIGVTKALLQAGTSQVTLVDHQINKMLSAGLGNIVVATGDHTSVVEHIETKYGNDGNVHAIYREQQLGTGGDLLCGLAELPQLFRQHVIVVNVDTILDWSEDAALEVHRNAGALLTISLTLNKGVPNEGAFYVNERGRVIYSAEATDNLIEVHEAEMSTVIRGSSTGAVMASTEFLASLAWIPKDGSISLYRHILGAALIQRGLFAYNNGERFFMDVGTVETWSVVQESPEILDSYLYVTSDPHKARSA